MQEAKAAKDPKDPKGPKYQVNVEGTFHEWEEETITVAQIRTLGSLPPDLPVIEVDLTTNEERTLDENETVELKPGKGFGRKVSFKRG